MRVILTSPLMKSSHVKNVLFGSLLGLMILYSVVYLGDTSKEKSGMYEISEEERVSTSREVQVPDPLELFNEGRSLKVERDNTLWKDPLDPVVGNLTVELGQKLVGIGKQQMDILLEEYWERIGINNLIKAVELYANAMHGVKGDMSIYLSHHIGSFAVEHSNNLHHVMQVVSHITPTDAPLHGAVWQALVNLNDTNNRRMYEFIDKEICYMEKDEDQKASLYENCIHGVGHGFAMLFEPNWNRATQLCKFYENQKIQYDCAGGVYMVVAMKPERTADECLKSLFPASCFRAFHKYYNDNETPCEMESRFIRRGCIWAEGTNSKNSSVCEKYYKQQWDVIAEYDYLSCLEGVLGGRMITAENKDQLCPLWAKPEKQFPPETAMVCTANMGRYRGDRYPPFLLEWLEELSPE